MRFSHLGSQRNRIFNAFLLLLVLLYGKWFDILTEHISKWYFFFIYLYNPAQNMYVPSFYLFILSVFSIRSNRPKPSITGLILTRKNIGSPGHHTLHPSPQPLPGKRDDNIVTHPPCKLSRWPPPPPDINLYYIECHPLQILLSHSRIWWKIYCPDFLGKEGGSFRQVIPAVEHTNDS